MAGTDSLKIGWIPISISLPKTCFVIVGSVQELELTGSLPLIQEVEEKVQQPGPYFCWSGIDHQTSYVKFFLFGTSDRVLHRKLSTLRNKQEIETYYDIQIILENRKQKKVACLGKISVEVAR